MSRTDPTLQFYQHSLGEAYFVKVQSK